jgi:hypothetical protein
MIQLTFCQLSPSGINHLGRTLRPEPYSAAACRPRKSPYTLDGGEHSRTPRSQRFQECTAFIKALGRRFDESTFRPPIFGSDSSGGIGGLSIESLEGSDSHARILQDVVDGRRTHDDGVALGVGEATQQCHYRQPQSLFHWIPLSLSVAYLRQGKHNKRGEDSGGICRSLAVIGCLRLSAKFPPSLLTQVLQHVQLP